MLWSSGQKKAEKKTFDANRLTKRAKILLYFKIVGKSLINPNVIYFILYLVVAILGSFFHPFFYALMLSEIINKYSTLRNFLRAITIPKT